MKLDQINLIWNSVLAGVAAFGSQSGMMLKSNILQYPPIHFGACL